MKIETDVMQILDQCRVDGSLLFLPNIQLDRKLYVKTNKVLDLMGGKWNRSKKAHVFTVDHVAELLSQCVETGEITDIYKELQFFETPKAVVDQMLEYADIKLTDTILEPSAGKGAIASALVGLGCQLTLFEIYLDFAGILSGKFDCTVVNKDFLTANPAYAQYDKIVANPPFTKEQDVDHASKMLDFLKPGGTLVCIMASSVMWRTNQKTKLFHMRLEHDTDYEFIELPENSFKESGTGVNTVMLVAEKGIY